MGIKYYSLTGSNFGDIVFFIIYIMGKNLHIFCEVANNFMIYIEINKFPANISAGLMIYNSVPNYLFVALIYLRH